MIYFKHKNTPDVVFGFNKKTGEVSWCIDDTKESVHYDIQTCYDYFRSGTWIKCTKLGNELE